MEGLDEILVRVETREGEADPAGGFDAIASQGVHIARHAEGVFDQGDALPRIRHGAPRRDLT